MAKKSSPVDAALEIARTVVPKKPVKAKGKKKVATKLDWGPGIPQDKLAYLNDDEMALVQANRMFKGKRSYDGIPAFPDPGDTGAGDNPHLPDGGGGAGTKGGGPGGPSGPNSSSSSASSGAGGQSASGSSPDKDKTTTSAAPSSGPGGGSLSAPARTEPSKSVTPTSASKSPAMGGYDPVSSAPSSMSVQNALDRIAQGSSIVGGYPGNKIQDRVPQATPSTVKYATESALAGPNRGLGYPAAAPESYRPTKMQDRVPAQEKQFYDRVPTMASPAAPSTPYGPSVTPVDDPFSQRYAKVAGYLGSVSPTPKAPTTLSDMASPTRSVAGLAGPNQGLGYSPTAPMNAEPTDIFAGANSPFANSAVTSFDVEKYNSPASYPASPVAGLVGPSVPAGTAIQKDPYFSAAMASARYGSPAAPSDIPASIVAAAQQPAVTPQVREKQFYDRVPAVEKQFADRVPGSVAGMVDYTAPVMGDPRVSAPLGGFPAASAPPATAQNSTPPAPSYDAYVAALQNSRYGSPTAAIGDQYDPEATFREATTVPSWKQGGTSIPSIASATPQRAPTEVDIPGYPEGISPSQDDRYSVAPSQQAAYDTSPSQQSGWSDEQRDAYLNSILGGHGGGGRPQRPQNTQMAMLNPKARDKQSMPPLPPWYDYDYLYTDYSQTLPPPDQDIVNFNNYSTTLKRGGRVGDSVDAALRLARGSIVRHAKTR
jgi:hypothetical protein